MGDGLSVTAVAAQIPELLPRIFQKGHEHHWKLGQPCVIRYCRVGVMNDIGDLLRPRVVVLLIGERPGLATAESLSAYMAYRPKNGDHDAHRNLISNIHARGVSVQAAAERIIRLAAEMMRKKISGVRLKEPRLPQIHR
jgi:ethanolamine ammonia-lyase small subunit